MTKWIFALVLMAGVAVAGAQQKAEEKAPPAACCDAQDKKDEKTVNGAPACCKSTEEKPLAKGDPGCCNAKGELAKFKVWVVGEGYRFFGCEGSAGKARMELQDAGHRVGAVQVVLSKIYIS